MAENDHGPSVVDPDMQFPQISSGHYESQIRQHIFEQLADAPSNIDTLTICTAWSILAQQYRDGEHVAFGLLSPSDLQRCPLLTAEVPHEGTLGGLRAQLATASQRRVERGSDCNRKGKAEGRCRINVLLFIDTSINTDCHVDSDELLQIAQAHGTALIVSSHPVSATLHLHARYDDTVITTSQAHRILNHLKTLLAEVANRDPSSLLSDIRSCTSEDRLHLEYLNRSISPAVDEVFHHQFAERARRKPDSPAVCSMDGDLTYDELDVASGALALQLYDQGVRPDSIVPMVFGKSKWAIIAMLAVAKAGGGFLFLDPNSPPARNNDALKYATVNLILTCKSQTQLRDLVISKYLYIDEPNNFQAAWDRWPTTHENAASSNLLYIIFTSGSTGPPKAVAITHTAFCSSAIHHSAAMSMSSNSRVLQFSSFTFDGCILEILTTLSVGGCVCVPTDTERLNDITGAMERMRVNWVVFTPTVARTVDPQDVPSLQTLVLAGEAVQMKDLTRWQSGSHQKSILMCYGPSECAVITTVAKVDFEKLCPSDLGLATGCALWIVDKNDPEVLLPFGAEGELLIEGPNVGRGYLGMPERTRKSWISPPGWALSPYHDSSRRRFYLSGDICKFAEDGSLRFIRRKDSQVKLRGQRVALSEVETSLEESMPGFVAAAAVVKYYRIESDSAMLIGFAARHYGDASASRILHNDKDEALSIAAVSQMRDSLPGYMIPTAILFMSHLPLTASGKLDRIRLSTLAAEAPLSQLMGTAEVTQNTSRTLTERETSLRNLWCRILSLPRESIGIHDHFFRLGADSVSAIRLVSLAKRQRLQLTVADIFQCPILADLAKVVAAVDEHEHSEDIPIPFSLIDDKNKLLVEICQQYSLCAEKVEDILPCTPVQEGLMLMSIRDPGAYIGQEIYQLPQDINASAFRHAWSTVLKIAPIWRTRLAETRRGEMCQIVIDEEIRWDEATDLDQLRQSASQMDMTFGNRLVHFGLVMNRSQRPSYFVLTAHHSLYDAWTLDITFEQAKRVYLGLEPTPLLPINVLVNSLRHRSSESLSFWSNYLQDSNSRPFPSPATAEGQQSQNQSFQLHISCDMPERYEWTSFTVVKAAWALLTYQFTSCEDSIFGTTVSGRNIPVAGIDRICGPTIATVPCRVQIDRAAKLDDFLRKIQTQAMEMMPYEHTGLQAIQRINETTRQACQFGCLILVQARRHSGDEHHEQFGDRHSVDDAAQTNSYALTLDFSPVDGGFEVLAGFNTHALSSHEAKYLVRHLEMLLQSIIAARGSSRIVDILAVRKDDVQLFRTWNERETLGLHEKTAYDLIHKQVVSQPNAVAVSSWDMGDISYQRLWDLSHTLSATLTMQGVGKDILVPLVFEKSLWTIVAMLGVVQAGGGFIPLDPSLPRERAQYVCRKANARVCLTSELHKDYFTGILPTTIVVGVNSGLHQSSRCLQTRPNIATRSPSDIMYVIFTSGSTGVPKGCVIEHRGFAAAALGVISAHNMQPDSRTLQFASYSFDVALEDIFTTLIVGGCVCVPSQDELNNELSSSVARYRSNHIELTPTVANLLDLDVAHSLRTIIVSGEDARNLRMPEKPRSEVQYINSYGLTETSITNFASKDLFAKDRDNIGRAVACRAWIVDAQDHDKLLPIGGDGELLISGIVLAREYLDEPAKTAASFVGTPKWAKGFANADTRYYKTGDLARFTHDGSVVLLGRKDQQIKLRGLRIELAEIEANIQRLLPEFSNIVEVVELGDNPGRSLLVAILVKEDAAVTKGSKRGAGGKGSENQCNRVPDVLICKDTRAIHEDLKAKLAHFIPQYMVPAFFITVEAMPLSASGKVDRKALRHLASKAYFDAEAQLENYNPTVERPATSTELRVRQSCADVLGLDPESMSMNAHFFHLGGDSLAAMALVAALRRNGSKEITVATVFLNPVLADIAKLIGPSINFSENASRAAGNGVDQRVPSSSGTSPDHSSEDSPVQRDSGSSNSHDATESGRKRHNIIARSMTGNINTQAKPYPKNDSRTHEYHNPIKIDHPKLNQVAEDLHVDSSSIEDIYPCTALQQGFMVLSARDGSYRSNAVFKLDSDVDMTKLKDAWGVVISALPIWRTRIVQLQDGGMLQVVLPRNIHWQEDTVGDVSRHLQQDYLPSMGFNQELSHFLLAHESTSDMTYLVLSAHHAVYDGLSLQDTLERVENIYHGVPMEPVVPFKTFIDFIGPQMHCEEASQVFWTSYLRELEAIPFPRSAISTPGGQATMTTRRHLQLEWNTDSKFTKFSVLKGAWALLTYEYTCCDDILFGATLNGRNAALDGIENVAGPTITTVPVRIKVDLATTVSQFLNEVQEDAIAMMPFEHTGLHNIRKISNSAHSSCDFNTLMVFQGEETGDEDDTLMKRMPDSNEAESRFNSYLLTLEISTTSSGVDVVASYNSSALEQGQLDRILTQLEHKLSLLNTAKETAPLCNLLGANNNDIGQIQAWNVNSPAPIDDVCIHDAFCEMARQQPQEMAIHAWDGQLSYEALDRLSTELSFELLTLGVLPESVVVLCFEKSLWAVVGMLAVLKTGCAFVSIDPRSPIARQKSICKQTKADIGLVSASYAHVLEQLAITPLVVSTATSEQWCPPASRTRTHWTSPDGLAYLIFTSGSSGIPKGVAIQHKAYIANAFKVAEALDLTSRTRTLQFANCTFDTSIEEICTTLLVGGCVCIPSSEECSDDLSGAIIKYRITLADLTPSVAMILADNIASPLETIVLGGELATSTLEHLTHRGINVKNSYGVTEASITNTVASNVSEYGPANIGKPIGCKIWIVDAHDHNILLPIGAEGEMLIEGACLAQGYLNDTEKTSLNFVTNPRWALSPEVRRFYKTGDLVRYHHDGSIIYCQRKDSQIKIRGLRVELGEVETHLKELLSGYQVSAEVISKLGKHKIPTAIVAFLSKSRSSLEGTDAFALPMSALPETTAHTTEKLSSVLPGYMIPSALIPISHMPLNASGKVDRKSLRRIAESLPGEIATDILHRESTTVPPQTESECLLQKLWSKVLGVEHDTIGSHDSFFHLGGDSIRAMQLVSAGRAAGLAFGVAHIFQHPTLRDFSNRLDHSEPMVSSSCVDSEDTKLSRQATSGGLPTDTQLDHKLTDFQALCTRMQQNGMGGFLTYVTILFDGKVDNESVRRMCQVAVDKTEVLRTIFSMRDGQPERVVLDHYSIKVRQVRTSSALTNFSQKLFSFDPLAYLLQDEPPTKFWFVEGPEHDALIIRLSHAQYDGLSLPLLFRPFQEHNGDRPDAPHQVREMSHYLQAINPVDQTHAKRFWRDLLDGSSMTPLPGRMLNLRVPQTPAVISRAVISFEPKILDITFATYLKTAWAIALAKVSETSDVVFGHLVSGRSLSLVDVENVNGPCINLIPIRLNTDVSPRDLLNQVYDQQVAAIPHETLGFESIFRDCTDWPLDEVQGPRFSSIVQHQNFRDQCENIDLLGTSCSISYEATPTNITDAWLITEPQDGGLHVSLSYFEPNLDSHTADQLMNTLCSTLSSLEQLA